MSKRIYCVGKINNSGKVLEIAVPNSRNTEKSTPAKRVDIVTIKMVRESSILYKERKISSPTDAYKLINEFIDGVDREVMVVCSLSTKNEPISLNLASVGTLNSSLIHPREIFKSSILSNAASIIIAHNHPSGDPTPSSEDINVTHRLKEAGKILGIELIDHIIVGNNQFISLKEKGTL